MPIRAGASANAVIDQFLDLVLRGAERLKRIDRLFTGELRCRATAGYSHIGNTFALDGVRNQDRGRSPGQRCASNAVRIALTSCPLISATPQPKRAISRISGSRP